MKHIGAAIVVVVIFAIVVAGSYHSSDVMKASIQIVPTQESQPDLLQSTLSAYDGILDVDVFLNDPSLDVVYDSKRISIEDLDRLLASIGFNAVSYSCIKASL